MAKEVIWISIEAQIDKQSFNKAKDDIQWFNKRIKSESAINLSINVANLKQQLANVKQEIKKANASGDTKLEIQLTATQERLKQQLTQASRELRNFVRTWEKDVSVLGKLFDNVTNEIQKTRLELEKTWKSTAKLDWISKALKEWKISAQQAQESLQDINKTTFDKVIWSAKNLFKAFIWFEVLQQVWQFLKDSANLEQTAVVFENITWSATEARDIIQQIQTLVNKTPFEFEWLANSAKLLMSVAWIWKDELIPTLTALWDIASSQWKDIWQAVEAFNDAIVWEFERLKEFWVRASVEWDKVKFTFKWQTTEVAKTTTAIQDYILTLSEAEWVAGSMEKQSQTLTWKWSNLKDTFNIIATEIWTRLLPLLKSLLESVLTFTNKFPWLTKAISVWTVAIAWLSWAIIVLSPALWLLTTAFSFLAWPIGLAIAWIAALWATAFIFRKELWLTTSETDNFSESQKSMNKILEEQKQSMETLRKEQEELNKKYKEWAIWNNVYKTSIEANKKAMDDLNVSQIEVQKWLDIINDKQLNYKQKVEQLNWLSLDTSEYNKLITALQQVQQETLKAIQLQQQLLKSKIEWLSKPTAELQKASADLNNAYNKVLTTWEWSLAWNINSSNITFENWKFITKQTKEQIKAQKEYEKQVKISNEKNTAEISKYNAELKQLEEQEQKLLEISRQAQDTIKKPAPIAWWWTTNTKKTWWSSKTSTDALKKQIDEEEKLEKDRLENFKKYQEEQKKLYNDNQKEKVDVLKKGYETYVDILDDETDKSKKSIEKFSDDIDKLKDNIDELNSKLSELETDRTTTLWERNVEVLKRQTEIQKELNNLKKEWVNIDLASQISETTLNSMQWDSSFGWENTVTNLLKVLELQKEYNSLKKEETVIKANLTSQEIEEANRVAGLSVTEKYLEGLKKQKEETQKNFLLKQGLTNQEIEDEIAKQWNLDTVVKTFNENTLKNLETQKASEEAILQSFADKKLEIDTRYAELTKELKQSITDDSIAQDLKVIDSLEKVRLKALETAEALRQASISSSIWNWSNSSQNTSVWQIVVNSNQDPKIIANEVQKAIVNAAKNAAKWDY